MDPMGGRGQGSKFRESGQQPGASAGVPASRPTASAAVVTMQIPSDFIDAREVQRQIREEIERAGFDPDSQFAIKLALEEALINAIKHGNKFAADKHVLVEWTITPQQAEIIIEDEGVGFDRAKVPDPTRDCNLEKLTGRGILLMETYMDEVEYTKGGRRVRLVRKNQSTSNAQPA